MNRLGRPKLFSDNEEHEISKIVHMWANNNTLLATIYLAEHAAYNISTLSLYRSQKINFVNNRPHEKWVRLFCKWHDLKFQ